MSSLYELTGKYLQLQEVLESGDDEYPIDMLTIGEAFDLKCENYGRVIRNEEAEIEAIDAEIRRLNERKKTKQHAIDRLKQALFDSMKMTGKSKIVTKLFTFTVAKKGGLRPLVIDKEATIPLEYCKVVYEPDKEKIRQAIEEDGEVLDFARLEERGEYLRMR